MNEYSLDNERTMRAAPNLDLDTTPSEVLAYVDDFILERELGGGGFGTVCLARDPKSKVEYAVKGLPPIVRGNKEELDRILANFRLVSKLEGHHIAQCRFVFYPKSVRYVNREFEQKFRVSPGDPLLFMSYAPGMTLSKWRTTLPGKLVPPPVAAEIVRQIADALDYAHAHQVLHRDVKPSNVMIEERPDGKYECRILDFGLAAEIRTSLGRVSLEIRDTSGTRPYMAPEQWTGDRQGPATDQYSLAALYCELVTGEVPFQSAFETGDVENMRSIVAARRPDLSALPKNVRETVRRALSKKPSQRFPSCMDFARALTKPKHPPMTPLASVLTVMMLAFGWWQLMQPIKTHEDEPKPEPKPVAIPTPAPKPEPKPTVIPPPAPKPEPKPVVIPTPTPQPEPEPTPPTPPPHKHCWGNWVTNVAPSCVTNGVRVRSCVNAGCTKPVKSERELVPALGHRWGAWKISVAAKRGVTGEEQRTCTRCQTAEKRPLPALPSTWTPRELLELQPAELTAGTAKEVALAEGFKQILIWCPAGNGVPQGFWLGKYEVSQAEWQQVMKNNPARYGKQDPAHMPVDSVCLEDCNQFLSRLNDGNGVRGFRLPTADEWRHACQAGEANREVQLGEANTKELRHRGPMPRDSISGNDWGLCDMSGNVGEWTSSVYEGFFIQRDGQSVCGGWWNLPISACQPDSRYRANPRDRNKLFGFRICLSSSVSNSNSQKEQ